MSPNVRTVPDRTGEHARNGVYQDTKNCRNPLFARGLPTDPAADLCNLEPGTRTRDDIAFVAIAGVTSAVSPHHLQSDNPPPLYVNSRGANRG